MQKLSLLKLKIRHIFIFIFLNNCLTGCITQQVDTNGVQIAKGIDIKLMSPQSFAKSISLTQLAQFTVGEEKHELLFQTEITQDKIVIVGLMPSGTRLFSLVYDGVNIESEGYSQLIEKIKPKYLLADMQMSLWPIKKLRAHLNATSSCFISDICFIEESADGLIRKLTNQGNEIISIEYQNKVSYQGKLKFVHNFRGYQIELTTLDVAELSVK